MAQMLDNPLGNSLEETLGTFAPSAHPPVALPPDAYIPGAGPSPVLGFAPAPTVPAAQTVPAEVAILIGQAISLDRPTPLVRPHRRFHLGWYEIAIFALILSSGALCVYRLMWAIQP